MDYEKKYKEALERAKQFREKPYLEDSKGIVDYIFPELKESEDKKILRSLKAVVKEYDMWPERGLSMNDVLTWLEKQGEQKPAEWSEEDENLLKLSLENLTELKDRFGEEYGKVGDCIVWHESIKDRIQHQTQWKPSDAQMIVLNDIIINGHLSNANERILKGLQEQLKKLKSYKIMTDKEKLEKVRAEIERRKKEVEDNIFELGNFESERIGLFDNKEIYNDLLSFIDSMQEELTPSIWHDASEKAEKGKLYLYRTNQNVVDINRSEGKEFPDYCERWAYIDDLFNL